MTTVFTSDRELVYNTLNNTEIKDRQFADAEWNYIPDNNNGNYSNFISFLTTDLRGQNVDYANAFVTVPMMITATIDTPNEGTNGGNSGPCSTSITSLSDLFSFRSSDLDLIDGLTISTDMNQTLVNENYAPFFINPLRLLIEHNQSWLSTNGSFINFSPSSYPKHETSAFNNLDYANADTEVLDQPYASNTFFLKYPGGNGADVSLFCGPTNTLSYLANYTSYRIPAFGANVTEQFIPLISGTYTSLHDGSQPISSIQDLKLVNKGFYNKTSSFFSGAYVNIPNDSTTQIQIYYTAKIPLSELHNFWKNCDFIQSNIGYNIRLNLTVPNGQTTGDFPIFQNNSYSNYNVDLDGDGTGAIVGITTNSDYSYRVQYGVAAPNGGGDNRCKLWYKWANLGPADNIKYASMLQQGLTKSINYLTTYYAYPSGNIFTFGTNTSVPLNLSIAQGIVAPQRMWMLVYPTVALGPSIQAYRYAWDNQPYYLTNCNIQFNNQNYYDRSLQPIDFWTQLCEQMPLDGESLISYKEFMSYKRIHCFDFTRLRKRLTRPNEPVNINITATLNAPTNVYGQGSSVNTVTVIFLIESLNQATINFTTNQSSIVVGAAAAIAA